jgi:3-deoxy-D-manno-octulosonic-acid transferase
VSDRTTLTEAVARLLTDAQALRHMARNAANVAEAQSGATARVMQAIGPYLAQHK